jgi:hypothetical protein
MPGSVTIVAGGQTLEISSVEMFAAADVTDWRSLLMKAQQQLGGVSTGISFWGSPAWAIGGAAVLGMLERAASNAQNKEGIANLERANGLLREMRRHAKWFPIDQMDGIRTPNPSAWSAQADGVEEVKMSTIALLDRGKFLRERGLTKDDVVNGAVRVRVKVPYVTLGEEFVGLALSDGTKTQLRWSSVDVYEAA